MKRFALQSIKTLISQSLYPQALKATAISPLPSLFTDQIYALFVKAGQFLDPFLATTLISRFSKLGDFSRAYGFLCDTQNPDTVSFNALISGYASFRYSGFVFELFNRLRCLGLSPDVFTLSSLVKGCDVLEENEVAHGVCLRMGYSSGAYLVSGLIENYARDGNVGAAEKCFAECLDVDNVVWTAMLCGYVWNGEFEKVRMLFVEMRGLGLELNEFSLSGVLGVVFDIREGEQIHGSAVKMGLLCGGFTYLNNAIMNMYCRLGSKLDAIKVFDEISDPDVVSWTEMISAASDSEAALELFNTVRSLDIEINEYTLINVLSAIEGPKLLETGKQVQVICHKAAHIHVTSVSNTLISMYGKCGQMDEAKLIFYDMLSRDSVSWNSLIAGYSENGFVTQALVVFSQMRELLIQPNKYTLGSVLVALSNSDSPVQAMQIHSFTIKLGFMFDDSIVSCLIRTYAKCNGIDESKRVFAEIDRKNVVHLNALAATLLHVGCHDDALKLFQFSRGSCHEMDSTTFSITLKACGAVTDLEQGRAVHTLALKSGFDQYSFVESAIIDMYCKCGSIGEAQKAFVTTSKENLAAWNAMIMGYGQHGYYSEVLDLFREMDELGVEPDEITYLGCLNACCHAKLVKEAYDYLNSMFERHRLIPRLEHYACLVDLLGKVGLLEDAKRTIDQMPIQPDARIWQILLSACNIHGHIDLGEVAAAKLLELQPDNESGFVLLSNLYASVGMWNAVRKLRWEMRGKLVQKEPGSSWIQVRGSMHYFFADSMSHHESDEIYMELIKLYNEMLVSQRSELDF